mmetsp:Transcript_32641/g.105514  ORF Transcript_32641/g.105514 Transcript_32641/m.105514 type:complete len:300 (-) Transcript_32641:355-1254(-)
MESSLLRDLGPHLGRRCLGRLPRLALPLCEHLRRLGRRLRARERCLERGDLVGALGVRRLESRGSLVELALQVVLQPPHRLLELRGELGALARLLRALARPVLARAQTALQLLVAAAQLVELVLDCGGATNRRGELPLRRSRLRAVLFEQLVLEEVAVLLRLRRRRGRRRRGDHRLRLAAALVSLERLQPLHAPLFARREDGRRLGWRRRLGLRHGRLRRGAALLRLLLRLTRAHRVHQRTVLGLAAPASAVEAVQVVVVPRGRRLARLCAARRRPPQRGRARLAERRRRRRRVPRALI